MIARLRGTLERVAEGKVLIEVGQGLTYEVLVPGHVMARLSGREGEAISLHTLHFLEGSAQGTTMTPRLAGFLTEVDRAFYELFVTCKGIGHRKALRSMTMNTAQLAAAIADRDVALLQSLPEIGRRTAETIVATLRGKVDPFVAETSYAGAGQADDTPGPGDRRPAAGLPREGLEVLLQLGENRAQAMQWIDRAMDGQPRPQTVEQLLARVYEIKAGG
jgi:Holliday junction DNA helicase RuvA